MGDLWWFLIFSTIAFFIFYSNRRGKMNAVEMEKRIIQTANEMDKCNGGYVDINKVVERTGAGFWEVYQYLMEYDYEEISDGIFIRKKDIETINKF